MSLMKEGHRRGHSCFTILNFVKFRFYEVKINLDQDEIQFLQQQLHALRFLRVRADVQDHVDNVALNAFALVAWQRLPTGLD